MPGRLWCKLPRLALGFTVTLLLGSVSVEADSTLHIGAGAGTACAEGCAANPNLISANRLDILQNSGGAKAAIPAPQWLILVIPHDTTNLFTRDPITRITYINPNPGGKPGSGNSGSSSIIGPISVGDPAVNSISATDFGIYELSPAGGTLGAQGFNDIAFASGVLPAGTFAAAFGANSQSTFDTPFVEAGLTTTITRTASSVPEPGTLLLLGTGVLALVRWKMRRSTRHAEEPQETAKEV